MGGRRQKKVPSKRKNLQKKPIIPVTGKLGKLQKSKKHGKKIKTIHSSTVDSYEKEVPRQYRAKLRAENTKKDVEPSSLDQPLTNSFRNFLKLKQEGDQVSKLSKRKKKKFFAKKSQERHEWEQKILGESVKPEFVRKEDESMGVFRKRLYKETKELVDMAKYEQKYDCELVKEQNGELTVKKDKTRKQEKLADYRKRTKEKAKNRKDEKIEFSDLQDHVQFGEVIHRPPAIAAKPRSANKSKEKVEKVKSLKLSTMFSINEESAGGSKVDPLKSMAYKHKMTEERQRVIDMYRNIKLKKPSHDNIIHV